MTDVMIQASDLASLGCWLLSSTPQSLAELMASYEGAGGPRAPGPKGHSTSPGALAKIRAALLCHSRAVQTDDGIGCHVRADDLNRQCAVETTCVFSDVLGTIGVGKGSFHKRH